MADSGDDRLKDVATLTRAIENVFRKLIRFLVGRISLVRLQEMINYIYVEECDIKLREGDQSRNVPLTKLAMVTGLDTRALIAIRQHIESNKGMYKQHFLRDLTPESAVVEAWSQRVAEASEENKKKQRTLTFGDDESEFEQLFRSIISSRGITSQSVINRLVTTNSATINKVDKTITLVVNKFSPYLSDSEENAINAAMSAVSNLISTIHYNIGLPPDKKLFQRQVWTFRLNPNARNEFRTVVRKFLADSEIQASKVMEPYESNQYERRFISAGIGLYYFEEVEE